MKLALIILISGILGALSFVSTSSFYAPICVGFIIGMVAAAINARP